jgi:hypothetical protein
MKALVFGRLSADAIAEEACRLGAGRMLLMVSGTLNARPTRSRRCGGH